MGWCGIVGPAGMAKPVVARLHEELVRILTRPDIRERIVADGSEPAGTTPEEFRQFMLADLAKWAKLVKESRAKLE
jgi:tripartite-type tricarboxylate transporter receptor subunit TctC